MKKSFCGLSLLNLMCVFTVAATVTVQAGEVNANESRLLGAASGTFTYEGKTYRASSQYVGQLRSYLCKDDVDLTSADVSSLISDMYANVGTGVKEGYLEEIGGSSDASEAGDASDETEAEASQEDEELGWPLEEEMSGESEDGSSGDENAQEAEEPEAPAYTVEETPQETQIVDSEGEVIFSAAPMIKAVGYHKQNIRGLCVLTGLLLTAILSGIVMVIRHEKS